MEVWIKVRIKEIADQAKNKVKGGYLFGIPIDMDDPDMVIAAVYWMTITEEQHKSAEELDRVLSLFGRRS